MALTAEEFKELALLARESGDEALEMQALEGFNNVKSEVGNFDLESFDPAGPIATNLPPPTPEPSIQDEIEGVAQAGIALGTGLTGGAIGMIGGTLEQIPKEIFSGEFGTPEAAARIEQNAAKRAKQLTSEPSSELGKKRLGQAGKALEPLAAFPPVIAELGAIRGVGPVLNQASREVSGLVDDAARITRERFQSRGSELGLQRGSMGAAEVPIGDVRRQAARDLPVPIDLTEGQSSREFNQVRFERETAKMGAEGTPLRDRFEEQNMQLQQNVDSFIDSTGATSFGRREIGESVDLALRERAAKDKARIRALYKDAEESGGMEQKVDVDSLADHLNVNRAEREENGLMQKVQRQINALEIGVGDFKDGNLQIRDITLKDAESLRRFINRNTKNADPNEIRIGADLKRLIDDSTEGLGNEKYKRARASRIKFKNDFESVALMKQLTGLKKGTEERAIALENTLSKSVISPSSSRDSLHKLRKVLQNSGENGRQAWRDIQAGTL